ncbi:MULTISPECIES: ATP-dependent DNA helicase [unclassified Mesobacillus]|uniref:ATP-dependent DNA helicase n=1 Tax=unclassified Mesobacillus TaxID=2675270 RepID=UPI00203B3E00|nr:MULTISPECIES: ATP-dependent DNA helicase [unclassified Mesobacillus]MCM3123142.1 ATP-dependent DNA helicase [Mesobacillus sp. MER 33]MCM3233375.1 ATP-dependent DNA helicase [Mesobacillus sp. MER 48]
MTKNLPFTITKNDTFFDLLGDYIGDVFYDILPEKGYELRDEQIYMAFQVEQAFKNKGIVFAEAGVGTGKTFVYLIYAILYARYMGKPAIVSCSDETLIEQLVKEGGDIEKLEQALGLKVDVRLAKAREQYVCVKKLDELSNTSDDMEILDVHDQLPDFIFDEGISMNSFSRYGDRKEYPWVTNEKWSQMAWDPLQQCSTCSWRHRCGQTLNRDYYRHAGDLIICSHDFYMEHVWTKESRKREGQMPLLPEASTVIFDEGHLLEFAAQKGLTYRFNSQTLTTVLTGYMHQDVREESLYLIEDIIELHDSWFDLLVENSTAVEGSNRKEVAKHPAIRKTAETLEKKVSELMDQLVFDAEMFLIDEYHLKIMEEYLEFFAYGLSIFLKNDEGIFWLEENEVQSSLVIMPRLVEDILKKEVFAQNIPFVFSSATLSQAGDFNYIAKSLGIEKYTSFTVESPFDYQEQMEIKVHVQDAENQKWEKIGADLRASSGSSLVLFSSMQEMERFRVWSNQQEWDFDILFEGDREISETVKDFQNVKSTVLCSYSLWEGLDVPGESLTQVIIASLPFPPHDPVFQAKRKHAANPSAEVDVPYMLLRLRQGIGRLIRSSQDEGIVHLWLTGKQKAEFMEEITAVLPVSDIH